MLKPIIVKLPCAQQIKYPILLKAGSLTNWQEWLPECCLNKQIVIISDETVAQLYGQALAQQLQQAGYTVILLTVSPGDASKDAIVKTKLEAEMFAARYDRKCLCIALGGGVVGDLAGFIAATYMRGIRYIQVPTTLLAMLDSSVGGKTAINNCYGKNLIGSFWHPCKVIMDTDVLTSLAKEQVINGLIEAIKIFLTCDVVSFAYIEKHLYKILALDPVKLNHVINHAVRLKAKVVMQDPEEVNMRMILNFGHTIGHALERLSNFTVLHGYAVALGIVVEAKIANIRGLLNDAMYDRITTLLKRLAIDVSILKQFSIDAIVTATEHDKKNQASKIYAVLLDAIGSVKVNYDSDVNLSANSGTGRIVSEISKYDIKQAIEQLVMEKN